ncbi:proton-conducting transporter membrane subunit [Microbispora rosea]|uniref:proton-conducting transporter transmembrane domain-containing protein n=1 Tax=Microbispora rosea TaxID=58117 RepID=UPI00342DA208
MSVSPVVPVALPLLAAGLLVAVPGPRALHRATGVVATCVVLLVSGALLSAALHGMVTTVHVGGWPPGFAITLAADVFSALMVCVSAVLVLGSLAVAAATGDDREPFFTPLLLVLSAGAYGAFLTADLFNLFVFVEVMLVPSYALLTGAGEGGRLAAGRVYLTTNLLASTVLLAGIALVYGVTGSVNLGRLAGAAGASAAASLAGGVVLLALAAKAAVVPLHGWLPRAYPCAAPAVTVLFSGLLTKVGVYAFIRIYAVVFDGAAWLRPLIMAAALLSMVVGVLAAVGEHTVRAILSFHMVSQIGYILLGTALFTAGALTATIFFLVQYVIVKAALLACAGALEATYGTGRLDRLGGLVGRDRLLAAAFMIAALSLAGLPPLSGFVGKFGLVYAAATRSDHLAVAVAVAVSLLTLLSMVKVWREVFWGEETELIRGADRPSRANLTVRPALTAPVMALALPSVVLGLGAQPLLVAASAAANGLTDTTAYVRAVTR